MLSLVLLTTLFAVQPVRDSAHLVGSILSVEPLGVRIELPREWFGAKDTVGSKPSCGHNVHGPEARRLATSRVMLDSLRNAVGEWDREYSAVTDSILSFDQLVAQVGPEPFGGGSCFADLQMRVYVLPARAWTQPRRSPALDVGLRVARAFFPSATLASRDSAEWQIDALRWNARYADYGGEANVQIFSRTVADRTLVLVFMRASMNGPADRDQRFILEHLQVQ